MSVEKFIYGNHTWFQSEDGLCNDNCIVFGGSGSGKPFSVLEPRLLEAKESAFSDEEGVR